MRTLRRSGAASVGIRGWGSGRGDRRRRIRSTSIFLLKFNTPVQPRGPGFHRFANSAGSGVASTLLKFQMTGSVGTAQDVVYPQNLFSFYKT